MDTYKKTNSSQVTVPLIDKQLAPQVSAVSPEAIDAWLDEKLEYVSTGDTSIRPGYDAKRQLVHEALKHFGASLQAPAQQSDTDALFTIDQVHQALLDHGCFSDTQREDILASLSQNAALHRVANAPDASAKLTIEAPNGDKIVCYGEPLDMMTLQKVYRTLLDEHQAGDASEEKSAPIAYLRAKASSQEWNSFELAPATDPNAFPVFGHVLAGAPLGVVDQVDKDDEEWGAHAWVALNRPVKVGTPVYAAPQAQALPTSEHGPVVKIIGIGPNYRPDEHDCGEWRENEDGVCIEFADGYRDCYYLSDLFAYQPSPAEGLLQDIASYIGCGGYNGASIEQLADRIRDELDRLHHKNQLLTQEHCEPHGIEFSMLGEKMSFKVGAQRFTLDYEPTEPGEFEFMRNMLTKAFNSFALNSRHVANAQGLRQSEVREFLRGLNAGYGFGLTSNDEAYLKAQLSYGAELREAPYASYSAEQLEAWRATEKKLIQLLASFSIMGSSDELNALEGLSREAVTRSVTQIKQAVDDYTRFIGYTKLTEPRNAT